MVVQHLINALLLGGIYGCIGVGFSLVYGVMNVINLAHGSFIMLGAYTTYWLFVHASLDPFLSIPVSMAIYFVVGYLVQKYVNNPSMKSGVLMTMILTYGIALIALNFVLYVWKADYRAITPSYSGAGLNVGDVIVPYTKLGILAVSVFLTLLLHLFMNRTKVGLAIQAVALNKDAAKQVGIDIEHIQSVTFGISVCLAAASGSMLGVVYSITPNMWAPMLGKAFVVAILGGLGNIYGAIIGGLVLALIETIAVPLLGASWQNAVAFLVFIVILVLRPHGLVGRRFFAEM